MTSANVWVAYHDAAFSCGLYGQGACPVGEALFFSNGTSTYDFSCAPHTFSWDFGDGATGTGWTFNHAYSALGSHTVQLTISNPMQSIVVSQVVGVQACTPPFGASIGISGSPSINAGQSTRLVVTPMIGTNIAYTWYGGTTMIGTGSQFMTVVPTVTTTYFCRLSNSCGSYDSDPVTVTVSPLGCPTMQAGINVFIAYQGPSSGCTQSSGTCNIRESIAFTGDGFNYDFGCATHTFSWNFGDGATGSGKNVNHAFAAPATFPVTLIISNGSQRVQVTQNVVVSNNGLPPSPPPPPPPSGCPTMQPGVNVFIAYSGSVTGCSAYSGTCNVNDTLTFTASSFGYDFACANHSFSWTFGDGQSGSGKQVTHRYAGSGTYPVTLTINNGAQQVQMISNVAVGGSPPTCNSNPIQIAPSTLPDAEIGRIYSQMLTATGGTPPYTYSLADGVLPLGLNVVQNTIFGTPLVAGSFAFSIRATDARSCVGGVQYGITVTASTCTDMVPDLNIFLKFAGTHSACTESHDKACTALEPIAFSVYAVNYDFSCLPHAFIWTFGDGQVAAGDHVTHAFTKPGTYNVTLVISNSRQLAQLTATAVVIVPKQRSARH